MLDYKLSAQNACPAFLQFVADLKKGDVSSQFIRELDGCDLANSEAIADALAPAVMSFLDRPRQFTQRNMNQGRCPARLPLETPAEPTL